MNKKFTPIGEEEKLDESTSNIGRLFPVYRLEELGFYKRDFSEHACSGFSAKEITEQKKLSKKNNSANWKFARCSIPSKYLQKKYINLVQLLVNIYDAGVEEGRLDAFANKYSSLKKAGAAMKSRRKSFKY